MHVIIYKLGLLSDVCISHPSGNVNFETSWLASSLQRFLSDRSEAACFCGRIFWAARVIFQASPWHPRGPTASSRTRSYGVYSYKPSATLFLSFLSPAQNVASLGLRVLLL
jgi:hypothetical protein